MKKSLVVFVFFLISLNSYSKRVIGFFDVAHPDEGCQGWALDPDNPSASIRVDFYANAPAGSNGSVFIGSTIANLSRPDVNSVTGYIGNHGFMWKLPVNLTTPCRLMIYAYGIDLNGEPNPNLNNSPRLMPILVKEINNNIGGFPISIKASSQWGGAIYSLNWRGKEFINSLDHGRLLQSASSFYNSLHSWTAECYNPTEAGSDSNGGFTCTDSRLIEFNNINNILYSKTQMAFYGRPGHSSPGCLNVLNTTVTSNHIFEKKVQIGLPNIPHAIKYESKYYVPANETYLGIGQFEAVTGYLNEEFNTFFQYNQNTQTLTQTNHLQDGEYNKPIIISTSDGQYAIWGYIHQKYLEMKYGVKVTVNLNFKELQNGIL